VTTRSMSSLSQLAQVLQQGGWHPSNLEELIEGSLLARSITRPLIYVWAWLCKCGGLLCVNILPLRNTMLACKNYMLLLGYWNENNVKLYMCWNVLLYLLKSCLVCFCNVAEMRVAMQLYYC
jgi:hypothetical protein